MILVNNPMKPPEDVLFARDSLEDILLARVKKSPAAPNDLLSLVHSQASAELKIFAAYLHGHVVD